MVLLTIKAPYSPVMVCTVTSSVAVTSLRVHATCAAGLEPSVEHVRNLVVPNLTGPGGDSLCVIFPGGTIK